MGWKNDGIGRGEGVGSKRDGKGGDGNMVGKKVTWKGVSRGAK